MVLRQFPLSNMCFRDQHLWRVRCPMICFFAVEWHLPHRVWSNLEYNNAPCQIMLRQVWCYIGESFCTICWSMCYHWKMKLIPILLMLCRTSRQHNKNVINWEDHHLMWVDMWNAQRNARVEDDHTPDNDEEAYLRHLEWLHKEYRVLGLVSIAWK